MNTFVRWLAFIAAVTFAVGVLYLAQPGVLNTITRVVAPPPPEPWKLELHQIAQQQQLTNQMLAELLRRTATPSNDETTQQLTRAMLMLQNVARTVQQLSDDERLKQ